MKCSRGGGGVDILFQMPLAEPNISCQTLSRMSHQPHNISAGIPVPELPREEAKRGLNDLLMRVRMRNLTSGHNNPSAVMNPAQS